MDVLVGDTSFARFTGAHLGDNDFTLIDVGCSGGLMQVWRAFNERLRAVGFDADPDECARLAAVEPSSKVRYVPGFVGSRPDHPFLQARAGRPFLPGNPWERLSVARSLQIRKHAAAELETSNGAAAEPLPLIVLPEFVAANGLHDIDFVKIDVDGDDLAILHSLTETLGTAQVLGVGLEVNFFGTDDPTDHSFHNTDRLMRSAGFELFGLTVRHYSSAALPSRYIYPFPTETQFGRLLQGDALYVRDVCAPQNPSSFSPEKLAKMAAIFSLGNLPDCAAEVLTTYATTLAELYDVQEGLDLLACSARREGMPANYKDYLAAFTRDDRRFYTEPAPKLSRQPEPVENDQLVADSRLALLERELEGMRASTCWRITAPLRGLKRAFLRG